MSFARVNLLTAAFAALLLVSCATTPKVDWNARIGTFTYDEAVLELGPPDKQATLSDGSSVAEWVMHREGRSSVMFGFGTGYGYGYHPRHRWYGSGIGLGHNFGTPGYDRVLRLTFDLTGKLTSWKQQTY